MKIGIVNDVFMAVESMRRVITQSREHTVAWIARDGVEAVQLCASDRPDLILMDLIMPKMDGVEATRRIMAASPCAIVIVTANVRDNAAKVFEAMGAGALDAVNTPVLFQSSASASTPHSTASAASTQDSGVGGAEALLAKIRLIGRLIRPDDVPLEKALPSGAQPSDRSSSTLVAIGASAGGPAALAKVLAAFPANFAAPIVVVQHVDAQFAAGLADWLSYQTPLKVRLAQEGDRPEPGSALLAGPQASALRPQDAARTPDTTHFLLRNSETMHLTLAAGGFLTYTRFPLDCSYRPSIDVFFNSIQRLWPGDCVAALLSGMGRDGAEGLKALRESGHHTIAQDEATSAVYGMPKAAVELEAASEILPLSQIGKRIAALVAAKTQNEK